ncbi:Zinc finger RING-type domain containing protein [Klebsormidium nitens]|uniref:Zinc finger RING-type domain containing protein n=1 Tax=Klebsormidium nitens TaxID=105231 RepID=A0A1Y1HYY0_KLENI|nr:Zinc finger RING-type domain containing protein [Klebsormidium nitens]|eukprot:GAQ83870.1 Zinc finger RING-type domain containing protein [Klebsormidium nitens]
MESGHANGLNQPTRRRSLRSQDLGLSENEDDGEAPLHFSTREVKKSTEKKMTEKAREGPGFRNPFAGDRQAVGRLGVSSGGASQNGLFKADADGPREADVRTLGSEDGSRSLDVPHRSTAGRVTEGLKRGAQSGKASGLRNEKIAGTKVIDDLRVSDSEEDESPLPTRSRPTASIAGRKLVGEERTDSTPDREGWRARKGAQGQTTVGSGSQNASGSAGNIGRTGGLSQSASEAQEDQHASAIPGTDTQTHEAWGKLAEEEDREEGVKEERTAVGGWTDFKEGTRSASENGGEGKSQSLGGQEAAGEVAGEEGSGGNEVRKDEGEARMQAGGVEEKLSDPEVLLTRSGERSGGYVHGEKSRSRGSVPEETVAGAALCEAIAEEGTRHRADSQPESGGWRSRKVSLSQDSVQTEGGVNGRHSKDPALAVDTSAVQTEGPEAVSTGDDEPGPSNLNPGESPSEEQNKGTGDRMRPEKSTGEDAPFLGRASSVPESSNAWSRQLSLRLLRPSLSGEPSTALPEDSWRDARAPSVHVESGDGGSPGLEPLEEGTETVPRLEAAGGLDLATGGPVGESFGEREGAGRTHEESNGRRRRPFISLDDSPGTAGTSAEQLENLNGLHAAADWRGSAALGIGKPSLRQRPRPTFLSESSLSDEEEPMPLVRRSQWSRRAPQTGSVSQNNGGGLQTDGAVGLGGGRSHQAPAGPELVQIPESPEGENGPLSPPQRRRSARHRRGDLGEGPRSLQILEPEEVTGLGGGERRGGVSNGLADSAQLQEEDGQETAGRGAEIWSGSKAPVEKREAGVLGRPQRRRFLLGRLEELGAAASERSGGPSDSETANHALPGGDSGASGLTAANQLGTESADVIEEGDRFSRPSFWTRRTAGTDAAQRSRGLRAAFVQPRERASEGAWGSGSLESEEEGRGKGREIAETENEGSVERRGVVGARRDVGFPASRGLSLARARREQTGGLLPGLRSTLVGESEGRSEAGADAGPLGLEGLERGGFAAGRRVPALNGRGGSENASDRDFAGSAGVGRLNVPEITGQRQDYSLAGRSGAERFGGTENRVRVAAGESLEAGVGERQSGLASQTRGGGISSEGDEDEDVPIAAAQRSRRAKRRRSEMRPAPSVIVDLDGSDEEEVLAHRTRVRRRGPAGGNLEVSGAGLGRARAGEALEVPDEGLGVRGRGSRSRGGVMRGLGGSLEDAVSRLGVLGGRLEVPREGRGVRSLARGPERRGGEPVGSLEVPEVRDEEAQRRTQLEEDERLARELQRREEMEASDTLTRADAEFARRLQMEMEEEASMRALPTQTDPHFGHFGGAPIPWDEPEGGLDFPSERNPPSRSGGVRFTPANIPGTSFPRMGVPNTGGTRGPPLLQRSNPRNMPPPEDATFRRASDLLGGAAAALEAPPGEAEAARRSVRTAVAGGRGSEARGRGGAVVPRGGARAVRGGGGGRGRGGGYAAARGGGVRARYGRGAHNWNAGPGHRLDDPPTPEVSFGPGLSMEDRMELLMAMEEAAHYGGGMGFGGGRGRGAGFGGLGALGLIAGSRDFDERDYEMLLRLDEGGPSPSRPRGATAGEIRSLPTNKASAADIAAGPCTICLDTPEEGDVIKRLPCMHIFHQKCIDDWLQRQPLCPICKASVRT